MYWFIRAIAWLLMKIIFRIEVKGKENIQTEGRLIICSNHVSLLDPVILGITFNRKIHFMAKKELFEIPILNKLFYVLEAFPVDRHNIDLKSIKKSLKILKDEEVLGIFPEGTRVNTIDKENLKEGIGLLANKGYSNILPVYIDTEYKLFRKVKLNFKPIIKIENFDDIPKKEKNKKITLAVYNEIYGLSE